jgi:DNA-binding MarR family transcriptional regulator
VNVVADRRASRTRQPGVLAWLRLMRVYHKLGRVSAEHLRSWGLSPAQFDVLAHVGAAEGQMQQELADSLLVTKGNVCQLLDRMEESGWIERRQEGRAKRLYLTPCGRELFDRVVPAHEAVIARQFAWLGPRKQSQLLGLLRQLERSVGG